jgi:predicted phosphodiesterase
MAKLIAFAGLNDEKVWINPGSVAMVEQEKDKVVVYFERADMPHVFLKGEADEVVNKLNQNMGWWW